MRDFDSYMVAREAGVRAIRRALDEWSQDDLQRLAASHIIALLDTEQSRLDALLRAVRIP